MTATTTLGMMKKSPKYRLSVSRTHGIFANDSVRVYVPHVLQPNTANPHYYEFYSNMRFLSLSI